ncbi:MAG: NAD-dependent deacetylase [Candidatus Odinarchaeota archaeon]
MNRLSQSVEIIQNTDHLIALTGAGISKESNVPTFRGKDGLWRQYNAMDLATPQAFKQNPTLVWDWYSWRQNLISKCHPNPAHLTLAKWEEQGILKAIITQNVDGLHRTAGSTNILEVHGNIWMIKCTKCTHKSQLSSPVTSIPHCPECGAQLRPDVVWFGESLPQQVMGQVLKEIELADTIIVIGTSALVQPSASFPLLMKQKGGHVIEVNIEATSLTPIANVHLQGKAGVLLPQIDQLLKIENQIPDTS